MPAGSSVALVLIRIPRGAPAPAEGVFREALDRDRERLHLPPCNGTLGMVITGPHPIVIDGTELDEYTAWEA